MKIKNEKLAFTLAEVLITLAVIGVVAAITLPTVLTNINERRNSEREANIAQKMTQALEHMRATGKLINYSTTEEFVDELKNHIKINKICDNNHLTDCWPTDTIIDHNGNEFSVANAKTGASLGKNTSTNNVGIVLADGASLILNYDNTKGALDIGDRITGVNKDLPMGNGKTKSFPYTTSVTECIDYIVDLNGKNKPNREQDTNDKLYDIRSFRTANFASETNLNPQTPTEPEPSTPDPNPSTPEPDPTPDPEPETPPTPQVSWGTPGDEGNVLYLERNYQAVNCSPSNSTSEDYQTYCGPHPSNKETDYWAGAKKACHDQTYGTGELPDVQKLQAIYVARSSYTGVSWPDRTFWSSEEDSGDEAVDRAQVVYFTIGIQGSDRKRYQNFVVCVQK